MSESYEEVLQSARTIVDDLLRSNTDSAPLPQGCDPEEWEPGRLTVRLVAQAVEALTKKYPQRTSCSGHSLHRTAKAVSEVFWSYVQSGVLAFYPAGTGGGTGSQDKVTFYFVTVYGRAYLASNNGIAEREERTRALENTCPIFSGDPANIYREGIRCHDLGLSRASQILIGLASEVLVETMAYNAVSMGHFKKVRGKQYERRDDLCTAFEKLIPKIEPADISRWKTNSTTYAECRNLCAHDEKHRPTRSDTFGLIAAWRGFVELCDKLNNRL